MDMDMDMAGVCIISGEGIFEQRWLWAGVENRQVQYRQDSLRMSEDRYRIAGTFLTMSIERSMKKL